MNLRIITAVNEQAPGAVLVRAVRARQPGNFPAAPVPVTGPAPGSTPAGPVKTRDDVSEGFRVALAAHHQVWTPFQRGPSSRIRTAARLDPGGRRLLPVSRRSR